MRRRAFLLWSSSGMAALSASGPALSALPSSADATRTAASRIGTRLRHALTTDQLDALRARALPDEQSALRKAVARDHREGRTLQLQGVTLSQTEAAWCLAAAEQHR